MTDKFDHELEERADDIAMQAAALPVLRPSRDLWPGIEARIDSAHPNRVALGVVRGGRGARDGGGRRAETAWRGWFDRPFARPAAVAALVVVVAGGTYVATRWSIASRSPTQGGIAAASNPVLEGPRGEVPTRFVAKRTVEETYDQEIAALRAIVSQRQSRLDPRTRGVIRKNLAVIDQAVAESRAALAKDPNSGFLADQLNQSLDTEVGLLRTVALLPTHT
jgi:hypothetical protein